MKLSKFNIIDLDYYHAVKCCACRSFTKVFVSILPSLTATELDSKDLMLQYGAALPSPKAAHLTVFLVIDYLLAAPSNSVPRTTYC